jgi:hypothetical protein
MRSNNLLKKKSRTKTVRHFTVSESMQTKDRIDEDSTVTTISLTTTVSVKSIEPSSQSNLAKPHNPDTSTALVSDLCSAIQQQLKDPSFGCLVDQKLCARWEFLRIEQSKVEPGTKVAITLDEVLQGETMKPYQFPAEKRAIVASILASSVLQLQKTHWLKDNWSRKDVHFDVDEGKVLLEKPYFSGDFSSAKQLDGNSATKNSPSQEILSFRPKTSLECLGIVLIELCFGTPIESHQDKVRLRPVDSSVESTHEFNLAIARSWTWEEIRAHDSLFSDPINSCLNFPGLIRVQEGRSDEVIQDMYSLIVKPLHDETLRRWPQRIDKSVIY